MSVRLSRKIKFPAAGYALPGQLFQVARLRAPRGARRVWAESELTGPPPRTHRADFQQWALPFQIYNIANFGSASNGKYSFGRQRGNNSRMRLYRFQFTFPFWLRELSTLRQYFSVK